MEIIRKKLTPDELVPPSLRYDPTTGEVQQTFDGVTYVNSPNSDPRTAPQFQKPPVVSDDPKCQAASNFETALQGQLGKLSTVLSSATTAEGMLTTGVGAAAFFFPEAAAIGVLALLALDFVTVLFDAGLTAVNAAFTTGNYDLVKCAYHAHCSPDGSMTSAELSDFLGAVATTPGGLVSTTLAAEFAFGGENLASNMAATGMADAACGSCGDFCHAIDFRLTNGGGEGVVLQGGTWVVGTGLVGARFGGANHSDVYGYWAFGVVLHVVSIGLIYTKTAGNGNTNVNHFYALNPATSYNATKVGEDDANEPGTIFEKTLAVNADLAGMGWDINTGTAVVDAIVVKIVVRYTADASVLTENC